MTVGLSTVNLANLWLDTLGGAAATPGTTLYFQLHTADPGAAGTTALSTGATGRKAAVWSAAATGSKAISNTPSWSATGADTITHVSVWDASAAGNFRYSFALSASKTVANGDTINLTSHSFAVAPLAA